jgi:hypothetical protein
MFGIGTIMVRASKLKQKQKQKPYLEALKQSSYRALQ